ncbi:MAG: DNA topoisomerase I [Candidatus Magnetoglobus multicellularis str. Araruama]|uniref:DNA topoisomerase 1 n=1 Tax=Candidatus Magnetoglobus multicellularis str. Araruama TaxID=890399 RepID=A0A1V1P9P3_9BACT|nr:MAG: DNA topoisomerase I [Candidatus Magnetoglobus multicellularis str. Araruama]
MSDKPLVIVESPTKVKTIKKYLGNQYNVTSTMGHIKDLPKKEIGIDIDDGFKPNYITIPDKKKVIRELKQIAGNATDIYLAPDPDREGEAIAWHTSEILKKKGRSFHRVLFHELTKNAILDAIQSAEELNPNKYKAQQARRILDRLVGYQISPLLWRKVKRGLSAGRVQSVAVRIIVERERAIQAFEPEEYWTITAMLIADNSPPAFQARLTKISNKKAHVPNTEAAQTIVSDLEKATFEVAKITRKTIRRNPLPPFITSTLQQEANHKLRFSTKKTMVIAQQLYEGIEIDGEPLGLITYMRTDSTRIANEAAEEAIQWIDQNYGPDYTIEKPRFFKNKKKVQDAHEAIRPTSVFKTPDDLKSFLTAEQLALYTLIWKRFVASQMQQALIDNLSITIKADKYQFSAGVSTMKFKGFMAVYVSAEEEAKKQEQSASFPSITEKTSLNREKIDPQQHFTQPPPRFSEASLVKELEENGIGRPSTYAAIISTIQEKKYVEKDKRNFRPTEIGFIVNDLLLKSFPDILDVAFTANMENNLDEIETAQKELVLILSNFYNPFQKSLEIANKEMLSMKRTGMKTNIPCPKCKEYQLNIKNGKNGLFLACSNYPDCTYSCNYERNEKGVVQAIQSQEPQLTDEKCEKCDSPLLVKTGRYGQFMACSAYPDCTYTRSLGEPQQAVSTGVACPNDNCTGEIMVKKSRRGKVFYGCSEYPKCDYALWNKPIDSPCPECNAPFVVEKKTKKKGPHLTCVNKSCKFELSLEQN